jgi:hypothetical protein
VKSRFPITSLLAGATLLGAATTIDGKPAAFKQTQNSVSITIPKDTRDPHVTVLKLTLDQPVSAPLDGPALTDQIEDDPSGTMVFAPSAARLEGGLQAQERRGVSSIGYWSNPGGSATWDVGVSSPATYQIRLSVSNSRPGAKLRVDIAGKSFTIGVPNTGDHDNYKTVDAGIITFPNAEKTTLRISVADAITWHPSNIRSVRMIPSNH